ncbi:MAG: hypothetical protein M1838_004172 [Thelocarpon superellum]|nr:MAG: hypothetical protein M1838_004172 [Thelocarpon superellum]
MFPSPVGMVILLSLPLGLVRASPLESRQLGWQSSRCPAFTTFPTWTSLPDNFTILTSDVVPSDLPRHRRRAERTRRGNSASGVLKAIKKIKKPRPLALEGSAPFNRALAAGHVMLVVAGSGVPELVLIGARAATEMVKGSMRGLITGRPVGSSTDHLLPVGMPYLWIRSLPPCAVRTALELILPLTMESTQFTNTMRDKIFNSACNLMIVPHWINSIMGDLLAISDGYMPSRAAYSPQAASLIRDYASKIRGYYLNAAYIVARAMAEAAARPEITHLFLQFCTQQWQRVERFLAPDTGWNGDALIMLQIGMDGQAAPELIPDDGSSADSSSSEIMICHGRCLAHTNTTEGDPSLGGSNGSNDTEKGAGEGEGFDNLGHVNFSQSSIRMQWESQSQDGS